jgi:hypothetical protein
MSFCHNERYKIENGRERQHLFGKTYQGVAITLQLEAVEDAIYYCDVYTRRAAMDGEFIDNDSFWVASVLKAQVPLHRDANAGVIHIVSVLMIPNS